MPRLPQNLLAGQLLTLTCLLSVGCGSSSSSDRQVPQLGGVWTGALTETRQHIVFSKVNLRLEQDGGNHISGLVLQRQL
jgi:hypothetical protein